jgi:hypothetical protein
MIRRGKYKFADKFRVEKPKSGFRKLVNRSKRAPLGFRRAAVWAIQWPGLKWVTSRSVAVPKEHLKKKHPAYGRLLFALDPQPSLA